MHGARKAGHWLMTAIAVVVIALSALGILAEWTVFRAMSDVTVQVFSLVETGVGVVESGVTRVDGMVANGRTEVQQAAETIQQAGTHLEENSPVLTALSARLDTRLAPVVGRINAVLEPVRGSVAAVRNAVSVANSVPFISERAPNLQRLDDALSRQELLAADIRQLDDTLRATVVDRKNVATSATVTALTNLTTRIDTRLSDVQTTLDGVQSELDALQQRMATKRSRLLFLFGLSAGAVTLLLLWVIYSQVVVLRLHMAAARGSEPAVSGKMQNMSD